MIFDGKTPSGMILFKRWFVFLFGGSYRQLNGGFGWYPGVWRRTRKYYSEKWSKAGYTLYDFVRIGY